MIVLAGPRPPLAAILERLGVRGPVALVTAGWQEREDDPVDLGVPAAPLDLHARTEDVFAHDAELAAQYKLRQLRLKSMQDFYRVRLDHAAQAARTIALRINNAELFAEEHAASLALIRHIDQDHLERCKQVHATFDANSVEREALARHVRELRDVIAPTAALAIAGGHVAVLLNRLRLFDVVALAGKRPIIAWSAGAMALTERVVLFHDDPPHGQAISEVLDAGLGLAPDLVVLPEPRLRLRLDDRERVGELAQRYAPAPCVALDPGAQLWHQRGRVTRSIAARVLSPTGTVEPFPETA